MNQKKTIGNVQVAKENMPSPEDKPPKVLAADVPAQPSATTHEPRLPIDLSSIDPAKIAMAEKFGIPIGQILSWMASVEERFNTIEKVLPQQIAHELEAAIQKSKVEAYQPPAAQSSPQIPGGNTMAGLLNLLPTILSSSSPAQNDLLAELSAKALKGQIAMSEAITNAVVSKIAARATDEVAGAVTGA